MVITIMHTDLALCRLFQLISPSLPIGAYTYSQGIEWAVEHGWIKTEKDLLEWLEGLLQSNMTYLEIPVFIRMLQAWDKGDELSLTKWNHFLLASRETAELRQEEINRARAFTRLIISLEKEAEKIEPVLLQSQHACLSYACFQWKIETDKAILGLLWGWLENLVLSAVKIIPLGQTAGQQVMFKLSESLPGIMQQSKAVADDDIGASSMALSIASSQHETQYTRLFRS
jgi:urease accessory protein